MGITRRTAKFADLAFAVESYVAARGVVVSSAAVDDVLNAKIAEVASVMRIGHRAAFVYADEQLVAPLGDTILAAIQHLEAEPPVTSAVVDLGAERQRRSTRKFG